MNRSVVVIGGGIAGLTAAFKLKEAGARVKLLEKTSRLGGVMDTIEDGGYLVETGPNTILETSPRVTELVRDLGLDSEKVYASEASSIRYVVRNGNPVALPLSPLAFFKSPLFSRSAKWRLLKEPFIPAGNKEQEESLSDFVRRRLGDEFLDYAINPFVAGVYAGDPEALSTEHGFPRLHRLEQTYGSLIRGQILGAKQRKKRAEKSKQTARMFSFLKGLKTLPEALGRSLGGDVMTDIRAVDLGRQQGRWTVQCVRGEDEKTTFPADAVVYAGQAGALTQLTVESNRLPDFDLFKEIVHPPVSVVALGFDRSQVDHPLDGFGILIPEVENFQILGTLFSSSLFPSRAPNGNVLLTSFVGGARQPENALKGQGELVDLVVKDLNTLLGIYAKPDFVFHVLWKQAIPQYTVGYGTFKEKLDQLENRYPGLYFAGNYRGGISVPDTIDTSMDVVERILSDHKTLNKENQ